jgi:hypothetical protein
MALSTYSELVESISAWLDGSDLGGREADFIALCEDEINARLAAGIDQGAFIRPMAEKGALTIHGEYVELPDSHLIRPIAIEISGLAVPWEVRFTSAERLIGMQADAAQARARIQALTGSAPPSHYSIIGTQFRFFPAPESSFTAIFSRFSKVPALSPDADSNWVLAHHRNAYLYGALAQAEMFGWNDPRMANLATLFAQAVDGIIARYPAPVDRSTLTSEVARLGNGPSGSTLVSFLAGSL